MIPYFISIYYRSSFVCAQYCKRENIKTAYIVGEKGLIDELEQVGVKCYGLEDHNKHKFLDEYVPKDEVDAVIVGFDRRVNFTIYSKAMVYLSNEKCRFIACEWYLFIIYSDYKYIEANGYMYPAGCILFNI